MNKRRALILAMTLVVGAFASLSALPAGAGGEQQGGTPRATGCKQSFASGAGATFLGWCFSNDGNINRFESPAGQEHILIGTPIEGYALCAAGVTEGYNNGIDGAGFGVSSYPAANTVRRFSARFQLDQVFSQNTAEKFVTVTMRVRNFTGSSIANVQLSRFVDIDMNQTPSNDRFESSFASVLASEKHMLGLTGRSFEVNPKVSVIESFGDLSNDTGCSATTPLAPPQAGDMAGRVTYQLGTIGAGQTKTVLFRYTRM